MDSFGKKKVGKRWEIVKIKIIVSFRSYQTHNGKFQKNSKKIQKIKKYHYEFISSQNRQEKDEKEKNKNYCSIPTRCVIENSKKKAKKFKKLKNIIVASF